MDEYREANPIGRIARPEEIAASVLFLAGDESSNITGAVLSNDGGYTARGGMTGSAVSAAHP